MNDGIQSLRRALAVLDVTEGNVDFVLKGIGSADEVLFERKILNGAMHEAKTCRQHMNGPHSIVGEEIKYFVSHEPGNVFPVPAPDFPPGEGGEGNGRMCGDLLVEGPPLGKFIGHQNPLWVLMVKTETSGFAGEEAEPEESVKVTLTLYTNSS